MPCGGIGLMQTSVSLLPDPQCTRKHMQHAHVHAFACTYAHTRSARARTHARARARAHACERACACTACTLARQDVLVDVPLKIKVVPIGEPPYIKKKFHVCACTHAFMRTRALYTYSSARTHACMHACLHARTIASAVHDDASGSQRRPHHRHCRGMHARRRDCACTHALHASAPAPARPSLRTHTHARVHARMHTCACARARVHA